MQKNNKTNYLKYSILMLAALLLSSTINTGNAQHVETLVRTSDEWSFFLQPELKTTQISGQSAQFVGLRLGPALDRTLHIGLAGYALVSSVDPDSIYYKNLNAFDIWYTGLNAEYTFAPHKILHGSVGCFIGGGQLRATAHIEGSDKANLFVAEPHVNLMVNLTTTLELGVCLSYRIVNGSNLNKLADSDLRGPAAGIFLRWTEEP